MATKTDEPIIVLHLISTNSFAGAERVVSEIVKSSDRTRTRMYVGILTTSNDLKERFKVESGRSDLDVVRFRSRSKVSYRCLRDIARFADLRKVQIVHSHNYKSDIFAFLSRYFAHADYRLLATNHNWILSSLRERLYKRLDSFVLRGFDAVVAVSDEIQRELGCSRVKRISVIPNGIGTEKLAVTSGREEARKKLGVDSTDFVVGCVASLTAEKNHEMLIKAIELARPCVRGLKLVLVGDGPLRISIEEFIQGHGLNDVIRVLGSRDDVRELYGGFDIFALVSKREGLPMVLLEAMASGIAVIGTAVGGVPDVIKDADNGLLVDPYGVNQLAQAIISLYLDKELRRNMGHKAAVTVRQRFSGDLMCKEYENLYQEVLRRPQT